MLHKYAIIFLAISSSFFLSCSSSHKTVATTEPGQKLQFIHNVTLAGNARSGYLTTGKKGNNSRSKKEDRENLAVHTADPLLWKYSEILGVLPQAISNTGLYGFIEDWMGVRYRYGGNDRSGIDCSAFVQKLYTEVFGVNMVRTAFEQFNFCKLVFENNEIHEGDLVFFRIHKKRISHVGIYLANGYFVHASVSQGVMISSLNEPYWKKYFAGAGAKPLPGYSSNMTR